MLILKQLTILGTRVLRYSQNFELNIKSKLNTQLAVLLPIRFQNKRPNLISSC